MPRIFDILRNKGKGNTNGKKNEQKDAAKPALCFPSVKFPIDSQENKEPEDHSLMSKKLISTVKQDGVDSQEKAKEIYENALETIKILLEKIRNKEDLKVYMDKIDTLSDDIFNQLILGDSILDNIYRKSKDEYYLPCHILNVLILSLVMGINMEFNKSGLKYLGLAALFSDCGMDSLKEITDQHRKLTTKEYDLIKSHILESLKIAERMHTINEVVKETIKTHHERQNGQGYPRGLKSDEINPYAKIISLVDTYEAMTNSRAYRERMNAHKAVKFIISSLKDYFAAEVIKVFINKMSVYPIGSIVRLNTQELARVIGTQPGSPLAPIVAIIQDAHGAPVKEINIIDLSKQNFPSIQDSI